MSGGEPVSEASERLSRLRRLEVDHAPNAWPAVQMRDITAVLDELDAMRRRLVSLRAISHPQNEHNRAIDEILKETE